jgi:hypothetical protein
MTYTVPMVNKINTRIEYRWNDTDIGKAQHKETNLSQCHSVTDPI